MIMFTKTRIERGIDFLKDLLDQFYIDKKGKDKNLVTQITPPR